MGKSGIPGAAKQVHHVKVLHPNSRKASKLTGKCMRKKRIEKKHTQTAIKQTVLIDKLQWFKDNRDPSVESYSRADMAELVQKYLRRFIDELEQIEIIHGMKSRRNRQHAAREDVIRMTMKRESDAFKSSGIDMPDLSNLKNLEFFLKWDGKSKHVDEIKIRKVKMSDLTALKSKDPAHKVSEKGDDDEEEIEDEDGLLEGDDDDEEETTEESKKDETERTSSMDVEMEQA